MIKYNFTNIRKSIQSRIFVWFMLTMTILAVVLSISSYFISVEILKNKVNDVFLETITYIGNSVEKELLQVEQISNLIFTNTDVKKILVKNYTNPNELFNDMNKVDDTFKNYSIANIFSYIPAIKIFGNNGEEFSFGKNVHEIDSSKVKALEIEEQLLKSKEIFLWRGIHESLSMKPFSKKNVISLYRYIKDENYVNNIGLLYISVEPKLFEDMLLKVQLQNESEIIIVDNNGGIVYHSDHTKQFKSIDTVLDIDDAENENEYFISKNSGREFMVSSSLSYSNFR